MDSFRITLYALAVLTSLSCAVLLFRAFRKQRLRLLMWSAICFACLSINNIFLFADLVIFPATDLREPRLFAALIGMLFLLYGFIWDAD